MVEPTNQELEQFESQLEQQQATRRNLVRYLGIVLVLLGALGLLLGLLQLGQWAERMAAVLTLLGAGLACGVAGLTLILRGRSQREGSDLDDLLNRLAPRILGGRKPEQLEEHRRRRRRR